MLQFLVLGLVPGTHLQITFYWLLVACVLAIGLCSRRFHDLSEFS